MLHRKTWAVYLVVVLLMATLAGCMAGTSTSAADCDATVSIDEAMNAQNMGMAGFMTGNVELTDDQVSSFLTEILRQNVGSNFPIQQIAVCFQPGGMIMARVDLGEDILKGADTLEAVGSITVENQHLMINLAEASASGFMVGEAALAPLNAQINAALADPAMGTIINIETGDGTLSINMGGM